MKLTSLEYNVCYRLRGCSLLASSFQADNFQKIKNPLFRWVADPFPFFYDGKQYIFAELGHKITGKGIIGCICLNDKKPKWKKCISSKYHMSYPNIFDYKGTAFMIPETHQDGCVAVYKCVSFPDKWIKERKLFDVNFAVDSSFLKGNKKFLFSYESYGVTNNSFFFTIRDLFENAKVIKKIRDEKKLLRLAGNAFEMGGAIILPTQNCSGIYGGSVIFNTFSLETLTLGASKELTTKDLAYGLKNKRVRGWHTYNFDENIETIDILCEKFSILGLLGKIFRKLKK